MLLLGIAGPALLETAPVGLDVLPFGAPDWVSTPPLSQNGSVSAPILAAQLRSRLPLELTAGGPYRKRDTGQIAYSTHLPPIRAAMPFSPNCRTSPFGRFTLIVPVGCRLYVVPLLPLKVVAFVPPDTVSTSSSDSERMFVFMAVSPVHRGWVHPVAVAEIMLESETPRCDPAHKSGDFDAGGGKLRCAAYPALTRAIGTLITKA